MSLERIFRLGDSSSFPAEFCSQIGISQQHPDTTGQFLRVLGFEEQAGFSIPDEFWYPAYARRNDRLCMCHRLKYRKRTVFVPLGRNDDDRRFSESRLEGLSSQVAGEFVQWVRRLKISQQRTCSGDDKPPCGIVRR